MTTTEHKRNVFITNHDRGTYAWSCSCGAKSDSRGIICAEYAADDWREAHSLDPIHNYPIA